jgi:hypothetical protein
MNLGGVEAAGPTLSWSGSCFFAFGLGDLRLTGGEVVRREESDFAGVVVVLE